VFGLLFLSSEREEYTQIKLGDEGKYREMVVDFVQLIISKIIAFNE